MKHTTTFMTLICLTASISTYAQVNKPAPKKDTSLTSSFKVTGQNSSSKDDFPIPSLERLNKARNDVIDEEKKIALILASPKDDCEADEARLRQQDVDFVKKNDKQIAEIIGRVKAGLKKQLSILKGFENGVATNEIQEEYLFNGSPEKSVFIEFTDINEKGESVQVRISTKNLIRYIRKFEAEAKAVKDDEASVNAFLAKYKNPANENNPEFFNLSLKTAIKAYSGCRAGCLDSVFKVSYREEQKRELFVGSGKNIFRVRTTTTMGWSGLYNTQVGTQLISGGADQQNVQLNIAQNFGESFEQAKEDDYWGVIRAQQLTINGIPVDGYLRRIYFDNLRRPECQKKVSYTFNPKSDAGPYLSYDDKELCTKFGLEILTASMKKTRNYNGSKSSVGSVFDLTASFKAAGDGKMSVSSSNGFYDMVSSSGVGSCDDVALDMTYRCGCERTTRSYNKAYKLGHSLTISCQ